MLDTKNACIENKLKKNEIRSILAAFKVPRFQFVQIVGVYPFEKSLFLDRTLKIET